MAREAEITRISIVRIAALMKKGLRLSAQILSLESTHSQSELLP